MLDRKKTAKGPAHSLKITQPSQEFALHFSVVYVFIANLLFFPPLLSVGHTAEVIPGVVHIIAAEDPGLIMC